ncbi:manganese efflux pump [bacterium]|nr:manganese efflux pump [bacterium]
MSLIEILLVGLALSMDAFAVTISNAFAYRHESRARLMLMPVAFGVFQALMPVLGFFAGTVAAGFIERYAGIVSFVILALIGGAMIREGAHELRHGGEVASDVEKVAGAAEGRRRLTVRMVLVQAVATSIDAFAVGVSFLASGAPIALAAPVVGVTTFACCVVALLAGKRFGALLGDRAEIVGGVVLLAIGVKALLA